ncbi:MAG: nitrous oxide reductase family maturation protein NosD [Planctomycetes bacterium]|nr:nitrous oxide reductase family maturation protein NosD [Planctomycetota bacterium]
MRVLMPSLFLAVAACGAGGDAEAAPVGARPERPGHGTVVPPGSGLQRAIDAAEAGGVLLLQPGEYTGAVRIDKPLHIHGPADAVIRGGEGSTLRVAGNDVVLQGFTIAGSGQRFDLMDGGLHVTGEDVVVEGITVREALFGILVERSSRVLLRGNCVIGTGLSAMGLRGDGIRLWETTDSRVEHNTVRGARDLVVWYSSRNHLADNRVTGSRYGTHFMYSHDNVVEDSRYVGCEVGIFVMYSHDILLRRNLIAEAGGAAGIGLGMKESGNITVVDNWFLANTTGIYIDNAPLDPSHRNRYERNVMRFSETGISLHSTTRRTDFVDNEFSDNGAIVKVGGQGDALECSFADNYYDTYRGYDLDGDERGDVPFEFRRLSTQLEGRYPDLALLHGAPAMAMVDLVGEVMPLYTPKRLMLDATPRMQPPAMTWTPAAEVADAR